MKKTKPVNGENTIGWWIDSLSTQNILMGTNIAFAYFLTMMYVANIDFEVWFLAVYLIILFLLFKLRTLLKKKEIRFTSHRIPFFAHAVANALAVGVTLEQALRQGLSYLKGNFRKELELALNRHNYGEPLGPMLRDVDEKYPDTGLKYLISLFEEYDQLGVGISPLLQKIADSLKKRESASEKIHVILAAGSGYAKMSIMVFLAALLGYGFMLQEQLTPLIQPPLLSYFVILCLWAAIGLFLVIYITSIKYANHSALKPYIKNFMKKNDWSIDSLFYYSGLARKGADKYWRLLFFFFPIVFGFLIAYAGSWFTSQFILLLIYFFIGSIVARKLIEYYLKNEVEDQMVRVIQSFPDFLQIFVIGLNSGLNKLKALRFAEQSIKEKECVILKQELIILVNAMALGKDNRDIWNELSERLPFEIVSDFCEIVNTSNMYGDSVVNSILQMVSSYEIKRLSLIEKKASSIGQMVIPVVVFAFLPLFLMIIFGPLFTKVIELFNQNL